MNTDSLPMMCLVVSALSCPNTLAILREKGFTTPSPVGWMEPRTVMVKRVNWIPSLCQTSPCFCHFSAYMCLREWPASLASPSTS